VTVNGAVKNYGQLPYVFWVDNGTVITYSYSNVSSSTAGKRFILTGVTGPASPITVTSSVTITGNYKTQYQITVTASPSGAIGGTFKVTYTQCGTTYTNVQKTTLWTEWVDAGTTVTVSEPQDIINGAPDTRYKFDHYDPSNSVTMSQAKTITLFYKTQYKITFNQSGVGGDFTGTIVTIDGTNYTTLPQSFWWDKNSNHTFSFASPLVVNASKQYVWVSTSGLSTLQSGTLTVTSSGSVTGNYTVKAKYQITFDQLGVGSDFTGTVVVIDGTSYSRTALPVSFLWDAGSVHNFTFQSPLTVSPNGKRYLWTSTTGLSTLQSGSITVSTSGSIVGNYKTQYYLTVTSPHDTPTPISGYVDAGTITASVTSPWPGPPGTRYVCTGWTGTGSVPPSGTTTSVTFTINAASSITWKWKTQYLLTVRTDPTGLNPQPTRNPAGEAGAGGWWYDNTTSVQLKAQPVTNHDFLNWDVDGTPKPAGVDQITVPMNGPHTATAHYQPKPIPPVGGYAAPIDIAIGKEASHLLASQIGLAFALLAAMAATILLARRRSKTLK